MTTTRRNPVRITHLTFAKALRRMVKGKFSAADLEEVAGFKRNTANDLINALSRESMVTLVEKRAPIDRISGPRVRFYELVRL